MSHLFDSAGLKRSQPSINESGESSKSANSAFTRTISRLGGSRAKGRTLEELQKFLKNRGLARLPSSPGFGGAPTRSFQTRREASTTTQNRPAQSAGAGGAAPTTSMTRAGVPTAQLGTLFGSPLNIPERIGQALSGKPLTGGLFDIINTGKAAGIRFPSATVFRRLSPSERQAAQTAARFKGISGEEFQAGILRSSPGDRPRPSITSRPRRQRIAIP